MSTFAMIFPGQGSQAIGMLENLASHFPSVQQCFAEASKVLDYDLWALTQDGPEDKLNQTAYTQPALLTAGIAVYRVWQESRGSQPSILAGHSLGEYTALVCSESLEFKDAVRLVARRGELMQQAVPPGRGAMAAIIGLEDDAVKAICDEAAEGGVLTPANYNSLGQVVIAGDSAAVERAVTLAQATGAKLAKLIPVSVPAHCALMQPAYEEFVIDLANTPIHAPKIPVLNNVDVATPNHPDDIRDALLRQLVSPVRWVEIIKCIIQLGITDLIETGPGKVLAGLNKRIDRNLKTFPVYDNSSLQSALKEHSLRNTV